MFRRVCGFRVRVWVLHNFQKFRVRVWKCYGTHRSSGYCGTGVQNSQKFRAGPKNSVPLPRVLWHGADRTHRISGYGYECRTKLTEVICTGLHFVQNSQKFRVLIIPAGKYTRSGEEFDLNRKIPSNLHGMFSLGRRPRGNP